CTTQPLEAVASERGETIMGIKSKFAGVAFAATMVAVQLMPSFGDSKARPVPTVDLSNLAHMKGPKKPAGATFVGKEEQPNVAETPDVACECSNTDVACVTDATRGSHRTNH